MTRRLAGEQEVARLITKLARDIRLHNKGRKDFALVGIKRRGVPLAERIAARLGKGSKVPVGAIDITLYRDDLQMVAETPIVRGSEINFDINGCTLVLVDDVIFTGRTIRAALDELADFGRPRRIALAVLIDRGGRELPIAPDVVGKKVDVPLGQRVDVQVQAVDGKDAVILTPSETA
jgi:pyrimidine operon attenuation protein/uracil phosphoribosyltransferase